jgi:hypothetical protein
MKEGSILIAEPADTVIRPKMNLKNGQARVNTQDPCTSNSFATLAHPRQPAQPKRETERRRQSQQG